MSQTKIYVGNLSYNTTEDDLDALFSKHGKIVETKLITDNATGRSKGFAFITFEQQASAQAALALDGTNFQERTIRVNIAKAKEAGAGGSRGGNGGRGGYPSRGGEQRERW